jgi:hypothetical protein
MAIESLVALGAGTLFLLALSIYAKIHRAEDAISRKEDDFDFPE